MSNELFNACATGGGFLFFIGLLLLAALVKYLYWPRPGSYSQAGHTASPAFGATGSQAKPA